MTARTLTADCLDHIATHDARGARLSAISGLNPDAEADARRLDVRHAEARGPVGPLHGIPIVLKDNIDLANQPTSSGNSAMAGALPHGDAAQTRRLRQAGAIILAKTNLSEFSFEIRSRSSLGGDVLNPFDRSVTAGGSSGGTAAAVAAGFAIAGLGSDTGGSIRIPAAFNGLVGLRPTRGLIDAAGVAPLAPTTDTVGPLARSVRDVAILLGVMTDTTETSWLAESPLARRRLEGARIGVLRQAFGEEADVKSTIEAALAAMVRVGAVLIDPVELPVDVLPVGGPHIVDWEFGPAFDAYLKANFIEGTAPASLKAIHASGNYLAELGDVLKARAEVQPRHAPIRRGILARHARLRRSLSALMGRFHLDAVLYPTSAVTPSSLENPKSGWAAELAACAGWPALTVPAGCSHRGIPIGLELLGRARSEALLLGLGEDIESLGRGRMIPDLGPASLRDAPAGGSPAASAR